MKNKFKKIISLVITLFIILPILNINISASLNQMMVFYEDSDVDFATAFTNAYGPNPPSGGAELVIAGNKNLTRADCEFIKSNLSFVISLDLSQAHFEDNKIPNEAFKNFVSLKSVALSSYANVIGDSAFENCIELFNIGFSTGITEIGANAFRNCSSLLSITLPAYLNKIGDGAFSGCSSLETIFAMSGDGSTYNIGNGAFSGVSSKCILIVPANSSGYSYSAFSSIKKVEWNFTKMLSNVTASAGASIELRVDVSDIKNSPVKYQWYYNGSKIDKAVTNTLVIRNVSESYAGRYTVEITIDNTSVLSSCIVTVVGQTNLSSYYDIEDTSSSSGTGSQPTAESINYGIVQVLDSSGKEISKFDISDISSKDWNYSSNNQKINLKPDKNSDSYTYVFYTKKLSEIYNKYKTGWFVINSGDTDITGYLEIPFGILKDIKDIKDIDTDSAKDYQLRITITAKNKADDISKIASLVNVNSTDIGKFYYVSFDITDDKGKSTSLVFPNGQNGNLPVTFELPTLTGKTSITAVMTDNNFSAVYSVPKTDKSKSVIVRIKNKYIYGTITKSSDFNDIENHWGKKEIINAANALIINGFTDGSFQPDGTLTRAYFCTMLVRAIESSGTVSVPSNQPVYEDIKTSDWFFSYVRKAQNMGLLGFITSGSFEESKPVLREEMAYMIARAAEYTGIDTSMFLVPELTESTYSDLNDITDGYKNDVKICTNLKLLQGSDGRFMPAKTLTRAEAAAVMIRFFDTVAAKTIT